MPLDTAGLVMRFATGTYVVTRSSKPVIFQGRGQPPQTSQFSVPACVQPITGRDLLQLPELQRSIESRVVYTTTALLVAVENGQPCDVITIDGRDWQVQHVETWNQGPPTAPAAYRSIVQAVS